LSEESYSHCIAFPIYGTGQGSGNSPVVWCFLSSILFDCHASKAHGAVFESPDKKSSIQLFMIGFVDDSNDQVNIFTADHLPTPRTLITMMQDDAQLWSDLLWASGGALKLPKCTDHFLYSDFTPTGEPCMQPGQVGPPLTILSGDRQTATDIQFRSAFTAHKTLGHRKDPSGNQGKQYKLLLNKSDDAGKFVARSALQHKDTWTYYFAIYLTSIGYPLANCHLSLKELTTIQKKAMNIIFAKCGFCCNTT
jgi:hypothetical protein